MSYAARPKSTLACVPAVAACLWVPAHSAAQALPDIGLHVDQDVFFPPADDQDYTMGVQVDFLTSSRGQDLLKFPDWIFAGYGHEAIEGERGSIRATSAQIGISAFTPLKGDSGSILADTVPFLDDRPYASILYGRARRMSWAGKNALVSELTVGVMGLRVAEKAQTWIHRNISGDVDPGGWPHQISDGGELTAAYAVSYRRLLLGVDTVSFFVAGSPGDVMVSVDGSLGFYTNLRIGTQARLGWVKSPWPTAGTAYSGMIQYVVPQVIAEMDEPDHEAAAYPYGVSQSDDGCWCRFVPEELYAWANLGWTVWGYNALLQGGLRDGNPVELSYDPDSPAPLERTVVDFRFGVTARWRKLGATWTVVTQHTPLFDGPKSRTHQWGSVYLLFFT